MNKTGAAGRALTSLAGRAAQATKINAVVEDTPIGRATVRLGASTAAPCTMGGIRCSRR